MSSLFAKCFNASVSRRTLARVMAVLFFVSLIPLLAVALYNYPADDDFGFVLPAATAWVQTGSLWEVARAIYAKVMDTYLNWQGAFASSMHIASCPMLFGIDLYFVSNWGMLALLCLSVAYLLKGVVCTMLNAGREAFWIVYGAVSVLVLQFMPSISDGIYWHTGTVYTITGIMLFAMLGLLIRCRQPQSRARSLWRGLCLAVLGVMVGAGNYGAMLGAFTLILMLVIHAFVTRAPNRVHSAVALGFLGLGMVLSIAAPGNAVRMEHGAEMMPPLTAVVTSVLDSFDLVGKLLSPQLAAALMLILPVMWKPLKESRFAFAHPLWALIVLYGLFAASIVPGVYTQSDYMAGRYYNIVYFYFLIWAIGCALYFEGALIRRLERRGDEAAQSLLLAAKALGTRFSAIYLAAAIALTAFGGFAFTIMNTSSVSAAKAIVTGEAAQFRAEMLERQEYIRVTDSDEVQVWPLSGQPYVFKADHLAFQGNFGRVRYMKMYFELFHDAE